MQATLGKLLVDQGGIAPEQLDQAVRQSVLQGGRLDTHLLEMGLIDEARLTELMAQAYEIAPADFRALVKVDLSALRLLPSRVAERCQVFPFLLEGESLHVLAPAPPDRQLLEEIGEMVGKRVTAHLATEYRIARALSHYYGLEIPDRFVTLEKTLAGDEHARAEALDPQETIPAASQAPQVSGGAIEQHRWPLGEALTRLSAVGDRDAVVQITLSYAAGFVDCAAVLGVQSTRVIGWRGVGGDLDNSELRHLQVSTEPPSALRTVIETSAPFIGALDDREIHRRLLESLCRKHVRSVLLYPVLVAGRVVALIYGDNGSRPLRTSSMGDFLAFCSRIGAAFENIILARKQALVDQADGDDDEPGLSPHNNSAAAPPSSEHNDEPEASEAPALSDPDHASSGEDPSSPDAAVTWSVQLDAASDLGSLELVVSNDAAAPDPSLAEPSPPSAGDPARDPAEQALASTMRDPPPDELESWDDEVRETLGTAGVAPSFLPSSTAEANPAPEGDAPKDALPAADELEAALREAEHSVTEHEASLDEADDAHPDEESVVFDHEIHETAASTAPSAPEAHPSSAALIDDLDLDEDEPHPDEESVVLDDATPDDDAATWQQALNHAIETGHQGGQHPVDAADVFVSSEASVALDEVLEQTVQETVQSPSPVEDTALELGTPRETAVEVGPGFSQADLNTLCDELAGAAADLAQAAAQRLRDADMRVVPMLAARFPGHVSFDPFGQDWHIPEPDELSTLVGFLAQQPAFGAEVALAHLDSSFPALRWYAVYLFKFVHDARAIKAIMPRLHDEEPRIRHLTAEVLRAYSATAGFDLVIRHLRKRLKSPVAEVRRRAIYFLGFFKDVSSVPHLIGCLTSREPELVAEASQALAAITLQTLGATQRRWLKWWDKNQTRSRVEWLIDGLRHKDRNIRYAASVELTGIAHETFGYDYDAKKREREKAVKQWERWWKGERKRMHIDH